MLNKINCSLFTVNYSIFPLAHNDKTAMLDRTELKKKGKKEEKIKRKGKSSIKLSCGNIDKLIYISFSKIYYA